MDGAEIAGFPPKLYETLQMIARETSRISTNRPMGVAERTYLAANGISSGVSVGSASAPLGSALFDATKEVKDVITIMNMI
ncbi:MAG: hypothetical protein R3E47_10100 [Paracoccaceae bacterium]